jgi:hypothetical protein
VVAEVLGLPGPSRTVVLVATGPISSEVVSALVVAAVVVRQMMAALQNLMVGPAAIMAAVAAGPVISPLPILRPAERGPTGSVVSRTLHKLCFVKTRWPEWGSADRFLLIHCK